MKTQLTRRMLGALAALPAHAGATLDRIRSTDRIMIDHGESSVPFYITGVRYPVRADSPIDDLAHFEHKKLVSTKGTTPLKAIEQADRERLLGITIVEAPDHAKAVEMVEQGEADGFAMDDVLLRTARGPHKP
jgi:ABC-type amino acid transport substrate-binding protein